MANFNATTGVDNVDLGNGTDSVTVTNTDQIQIGDYFQGGNATDDIIISGASGVSVNLSGAGTTAGTSGFNDFERLVFDNTSGTSSATLSSGQFSGSLIDPDLAIVGAAGVQSVVVDMAATGSFSVAGWTFNTWASGIDTITVNGTGGADTITGSTVNDTLNGGGGADSITGGTGADTMSGGSGSDTFFFAAGDTALTIGGSAMAGTISGYDVITDFAAGATAAASEKIDFATSSQVAGNGTTNGNNSTLQLHTGNVVSSHSITNGIITFDDTDTFAAAVPLTSLSDVAAVTQYLENNDGSNGDVVAFKAIISGITHTFIWRGRHGTESSNVLVDLVNVDATSISEGGDQISVITDVNEAPTAVVLSNQVTSTAENGGPVKVADIAVTDDGLGTNAVSLAGADAGSFSIQNGNQLWFTGGASFEAQATYNVTVRVDDGTVGGSPDASQSFALSITDVNEAPTAVVLNNQVTSTAENGGPVKVADIAVTDDGLGTNAVSLAGADAGSFSIQNGNQLWFTGGASFEAQATYNVTVRVDDGTVGGSPDASQSFALSITDVNEAPTAVVLSNQVTSTAENGGPVKVADIAVTDDGLGTNAVSLAGADAGSFSIQNGNQLWFTGGASFEAQATYNVTVRVDDGTVGGSPDASQSFALSITDVNEAPTAVVLSNQVTSTAENGGPVKVADIAVTDDGLGTNAVSLAGADAGSFSIQNGNQLWFTGGASFEAQATYNVTVRVDDGTVGGSPDASQSFALSITDVNEAPTAVVLNNQVTSTAENGGPVKVADIAVTDDGLGTSAVSLSGADAGSFSIQNGNQLWFTGGANFEAQNSYNVTVQIDDGTVGGSPDASQSFALSITDVNEAPTAVVLNNQVTSTAENGGSVKVADIAVTDDGLGTSAVSLSGADAGSFSIQNGNELWFTGGANFEAQNSYNVTVRVDDGTVGGSPDASQSFALSITDVNEAPTAVVLNNQVTSTAENGGPVKVADIAVTDDGLGTNAVSLAGADAGSFSIQNGNQLWFTGGASFEAQATYNVTVRVDDGTVGGSPDASQSFALSITNVNEAPVVDLNGAGGGNNADQFFLENGAAVAIAPATISITDPDDINLVSASIVLTNAKPGDSLSILGALPGGITSSITTGPGTITVALSGTASRSNYQTAIQQVVFNNPGDNPDTTDRNITVSASDGTDAINAAITVHVAGVNDLPVNSLPGTQHVEANTATAISGLSIADPDAGAGTLTTTLSVAHGTLAVISAGGAAVSGSGTASVTLTGTLSQINTTLAAASNLAYTGAHDFFGTDTLNVLTNDNGNTGAGGTLTDTDNVTINVNTLINGTPGDDSYIALPGQEMINGFGGIDSVTFNFKLVEATVGYEANKVIIDGPGGSHTVLTGFEVFNFTDGTVNNNDATRLVDDLFYYSKYHDVWNAHVDADAHFVSFGRDEGRDPSFFFSTVVYRSANPDVAASGVNPLDHFGLSGWLEGRVPSIHFDPLQYLAANPDVAAAGVNPLRHYLEFGYQEGRLPFAPSQLIAANGFDYVYYLQHNPDVAASSVDPLQHFNTLGWHEGRDPNAWFDTAGYLAHYADVAASGVNPLDHYDQFGWKEGRDPSAGFDTAGYLAANPDVAAAHVNPLDHFLTFGIHEGRQAVNDGVWH